MSGRLKGQWGKHIGKNRIMICGQCKKEFKIDPYRIGIAKYCSYECRNKAYETNKLYHRKHTDESRKLMSLKAKKGPEHPFWKGGVCRNKNGNWLSRIWRVAVFIRDDYTCQECGERGGRLEADHIKPWALYPELRYAIDNGRTLCHDCHEKTETYGWKYYWLQIKKIQ